MVESGFPKSVRLLKAEDYQAVFNHSRFKVSCRAFLILALPHDGPASRLGIVVAKKHVAKAVRRNRIKRLIREWFRTSEFEQPVDLVVLARQDADKLANQLLTKKLDSLGADISSKLGSQ